MPTLAYLLFAYGFTFGVQNKATFLRGRFAFLDALVKCTYCVGFHAGWLSWVVYLGIEQPSLGLTGVEISMTIFRSVAVWGLASAGFCYALDSAIRWCEYRPR